MGLTANEVKNRLINVFKKAIAEEFKINPKKVYIGNIYLHRLYEEYED